MRRKSNPKQGTLALEPRTVRLVARVTVEEKALFERVAKARHTTVSEFLRQAAHSDAAKTEKEKREAA